MMIDVKLFFWYLLLMSGSTYLIRAVPFVLVKKKIESSFVQSFLFYIPYAVLTAMTIPAVFFATNQVISAGLGVLVAVILALRNKSLTVVAMFACLTVLLAEFII